MPDSVMQDGEDLVVWDTDGLPDESARTTVLWRSHGTGSKSDVVSIPRLIEEYAEQLRARYLAWIYEIGETRIRGTRLVDHLELRPGFSAWWMSLLAEKCNYSKSPQITDAIRLLAFGLWAEKLTFNDLLLVSANPRLAEIIRTWCDANGKSFKWQCIPDTEIKTSWLRQFYDSLPHFLQGVIWLSRYLIRRWPLRGEGLGNWYQTDGHITFISYLFNLVPEAPDQGRFESRYWGGLPDTLSGDDCKSNWLHLYVEDPLLPTAREAAKAIRRFNETARGKQVHATLDTFIGIGVILKTLQDWLRIGIAGMSLQQATCWPKAYGFDFWPLFREDWKSSLFGQTAVFNLLTYNLFEEALGVLPSQKTGVYLQENQGWEFGLIHAWRTAGHGCLNGTPHSTVRYWDLRYFFDPRSYRREGINALPLPNKIALNGQEGLNAYRQGLYPEGDLVEVEALRYLYLLELMNKSRPMRMEGSPLRVLVLSDYLKTNTIQQMRLLERAIPLLPADMAITVKPHPNCQIQPTDYLGILMEMTTQPVSELLAGCDVAFASSVTSAAVDAYCAGVPVVSLLDLNSLDLSPLRGRDRALLASTPEELADALVSAASTQCSATGWQDFFTLDSGLPRWRKLLRVDSGESST